MPFDPAILRVMAITYDHPEDQSIQSVLRSHVVAERIIATARAAAHGGATSIQVRLKHHADRAIMEITRAIIQTVNVPVLVNDRFDIALVTQAAGVHVGADDIPVADVRRVTPPNFIIGTSVGCDAEVANAELADFVGIGPVFSTSSKHDAGQAIGAEELARLTRKTGKPSIAIGGITADNASRLFETPEVIDAGVAGVAVIRGIVGAKDPFLAAQTLRAQVDRALGTR